jgi:hypothetical protein
VKNAKVVMGLASYAEAIIVFSKFAKSTWHPFIFGKTEKIVLQQFGIQLGKF